MMVRSFLIGVSISLGILIKAARLYNEVEKVKYYRSLRKKEQDYESHRDRYRDLF